MGHIIGLGSLCVVIYMYSYSSYNYQHFLIGAGGSLVLACLESESWVFFSVLMNLVPSGGGGGGGVNRLSDLHSESGGCVSVLQQPVDHLICP